MKSNKLNICTNEEMQEWIANMKNERLVFVDNGIDEFITRFIDLPDIIVDLNRRFGSQDLKVFNFIEPEEKPIITTNGMYLNKISSEDRQAIIERLIKLQEYQEEIKYGKYITRCFFPTLIAGKSFLLKVLYTADSDIFKSFITSLIVSIAKGLSTFCNESNIIIFFCTSFSNISSINFSVTISIFSILITIYLSSNSLFKYLVNFCSSITL